MDESKRTLNNHDKSDHLGKSRWLNNPANRLLLIHVCVFVGALISILMAPERGPVIGAGIGLLIAIFVIVGSALRDM